MFHPILVTSFLVVLGNKEKIAQQFIYFSFCLAKLAKLTQLALQMKNIVQEIMQPKHVTSE